MTDFARVFQPILLRLNYLLISTICYLQKLFIHKKITPARLACLCFSLRRGIWKPLDANVFRSSFGLNALNKGKKNAISKRKLINLNTLVFVSLHLSNELFLDIIMKVRWSLFDFCKKSDTSLHFHKACKLTFSSQSCSKHKDKSRST